MKKPSVKINEVNMACIKKINSKKITSLLIAATLGLSGLVGCNSKKNSSSVSEAETIVNEEVSSEEISTIATTITDSTTTEAVTTASQETTTNISDDKKDLNNDDYFSSYLWHSFLASLHGKLKNRMSTPIVSDKFDSALITLNMEYLEENNTKYAANNSETPVLDEYYIKSIGSNEYIELENMNDIFSQIRENNTDYVKNNYFDPRDLLLGNKNDEKKVLDTLYQYTIYVFKLKAELYNLHDGNLELADSQSEVLKNIEQYYEVIKNFATGKGKIEGFAQMELSDGAGKVAEELMQEFSVLSANYISNEKREELDKRLNSSNFYTNMKDSIAAHIYYARREIGEEKIQQLYEENKSNIIAAQTASYNNLKKIGVTEAEANALFNLANIDYFVENFDDRTFYDEVISAYGTDYIDYMYANAKSAVEKIESYNSKVVKEEELYTYEDLFIQNGQRDRMVDRASLYNLTEFAYLMRTENQDIKYILEAYTLYSSTLGQLKLSLNDADETIYTVDKNSLSYGARQISNWMMQYAFTNSKAVLNDDTIVDSVVNFTDVDSRRTYESLVIKVDGYCAGRNGIVYDYYAK